MKMIVFLFLVSALNNPTPTNIPLGEKFQIIEKSFPNYHFKFYKKVDAFSNFNEPPLTFAMLGYWSRGEGYVLVFSDDKLVQTTMFTNFEDYNKYITNPKEKETIKINDKNLIL